MIITINTDASFCPDTKFGAYAFWIVSNQFKIQKSAILKKTCKTSHEAELKCILNAIVTIKNEIGTNKIVINTDSMNSIYILTNDRNMIDKYRLTWGKPYHKMYKAIIKRYKQCSIEFRHVKAHQDTSTARTWVNDWCDSQAKQQLKIARQNGNISRKN